MRLRTSILIAVLACSSRSQVPWIRNLSVPNISRDDSWGPVYEKGGSRLQCDAAGSLYLSVGDSMLIGAEGGRTWRKPARSEHRFRGQPIPIALGPDGLVAWGGSISLDKGISWRSFTNPYLGSAFALCFTNKDALIMGQSYDTLELSVDTGVTWHNVRNGGSWGETKAIVEMGPEWVMAAGGTSYPVFSDDAGETWSTAQEKLAGANATIPVHFMVSSPGTPYGLWAFANGIANQILDDGRVDKGVLQYYAKEGTSLTLVSIPPGRGYPDSAITSLEATADPGSAGDILWLGCWGQGVFVSTDKGKSWQARNEGLSDLYIEAMARGKDGTLHVLTKEGLYSLTGARSAISRRDQGPGAFSRRARFRVDGRAQTQPPQTGCSRRSHPATEFGAGPP